VNSECQRGPRTLSESFGQSVAPDVSPDVGSGTEGLLEAVGECLFSLPVAMIAPDDSSVLQSGTDRRQLVRHWSLKVCGLEVDASVFEVSVFDDQMIGDGMD